MVEFPNRSQKNFESDPMGHPVYLYTLNLGASHQWQSLQALRPSVREEIWQEAGREDRNRNEIEHCCCCDVDAWRYTGDAVAFRETRAWSNTATASSASSASSAYGGDNAADDEADHRSFGATAAAAEREAGGS